MEHEKETFQVTVQTNKGLEPMTLTRTVEETKIPDQDYELTLKITRDKDNVTLSVLAPDSDN